MGRIARIASCVALSGPRVWVAMMIAIVAPRLGISQDSPLPRSAASPDSVQYLFAGIDDGRIIKIAPDGGWTLYGTGLGTMRGLDFDTSGNLWVAAKGALVKIAPLRGGQTATYDNGLADVFCGDVRSPLGLAVAPDGDIWIAEHFDGVIKVDGKTGTKTEIEVGGGAYSVERGPNGHMYVSRQHANTVLEFHPSGEPVHGTPAHPEAFIRNYGFHRSLAFTREGNILLIHDEEISIIAPSGAYWGTFFDWDKDTRSRETPDDDMTRDEFLTRGMHHPMDLAIDASGTVFGSDAPYIPVKGEPVGGTIFKYHRDGTRQLLVEVPRRRINWMQFWPSTTLTSSTRSE